MKKKIILKESELITLIKRISSKYPKQNKPTLNESKSKLKSLFLDRGIITSEEFQSILNADPSPTKKYSPWMAKMMKNEGKTIDQVRNLVEEFDLYVQRERLQGQQKDINTYKTFDDLFKIVDDLNNRATASNKELETDYDVLVDTPEITVYRPNTHEASRKLGMSKMCYRDGKDSVWCTTHKSSGQWDSHFFNKMATFYYIAVNGGQPIECLKEKYGRNYLPFTRFALLVFPDNRMEGYDAENRRYKGRELEEYRECLGL
jgi:hypothetical protein